MTELGVTGPEIETLGACLMFSVPYLQAQVDLLDAQIATLTAQRDAALVTASKLVDPTPPEPEVVEADPVTGV